MNEETRLRQALVPGPAGMSPGADTLRRFDENNRMQAVIPATPPAARSQTPPGTGGVGSIAKAIAGVMKEVGTVQKGGVNEFHHYKYARMEDILQVLTPLMARNGLAIIQNEVETKLAEGNRVAVTYEFSIIHESGEVWPERPRFTGMASARDRKGNLDDKAINKCHTAARKYFLLSLFQVPTGEMDDADGEPPPARQEQQATVPGPQRGALSNVKFDPKPHRIAADPSMTAAQWSTKFLACVTHAKTPDEVRQWDDLNDDFLHRLNSDYPDIYARVQAAVNRRVTDMHPKPAVGNPLRAAMPSPKPDPTAAINWVAQQLLAFRTYEAAEAFWNEVVAPREGEFDVVDFELLLAEWKRAEARLAPDGELPPDEAPPP